MKGKKMRNLTFFGLPLIRRVHVRVHVLEKCIGGKSNITNCDKRSWPFCVHCFYRYLFIGLK